MTLRSTALPPDRGEYGQARRGIVHFQQSSPCCNPPTPASSSFRRRYLPPVFAGGTVHESIPHRARWLDPQSGGLR